MGKNRKIIIISAVIMLVVVVGIVFVISKTKTKKGWDKKQHTSDELFYHQSIWACDGVLMKVEKGYLLDNGYSTYSNLCFWDGKSEHFSTICKDPNCTHDNAKCCAYFNRSAESFQTSNNYIFYYDYEDQDCYLYRCDMNGKNRVKLLCLSYAKDGYYQNYFYVHGNHVFAIKWALDGESPFYIYDYDMTLSKSDKNFRKEVYKSEEYCQIYINDISGDKVQFMVNKDKNYAFYEYNWKTNQVELLFESDQDHGFVRYVGDSIVYTSDEGNMLRQPDGTTKCIKTGANEQLAYDGKNIYIDNVPQFTRKDEANAVTVFDSTGTYIETITPPEGLDMMTVCFFGDQDKLFYATFTNKEFWVMDKHNTEKGWTRIEYK